MSTGTRFPLVEAEVIAGSLVSVISSACERIEVAGSIRRARPDVGDIELVAVPRINSLPEGMWGKRLINRLTERLDVLIDADVLSAHPTDPKRGERYSKLIDPLSGLQVDVFSASADTYGLILLIRTGSAAYSQRFVTDLRGRGLHSASGQLHRGGLGCGAYECELVPTPEEVDVYTAAGWPFVNPGMRA